MEYSQKHGGEWLSTIPNQKSTKLVEILLSVMMIDSSKHTKIFLKSRSKFQCYYNNVGYCKYRENCHYQHFTKICEKNYAEILFASSDIPEHVNMEQNVDSCKDSVVFITTKLVIPTKSKSLLLLKKISKNLSQMYPP